MRRKLLLILVGCLLIIPAAAQATISAGCLDGGCRLSVTSPLSSTQKYKQFNYYVNHHHTQADNNRDFSLIAIFGSIGVLVSILLINYFYQKSRHYPLGSPPPASP